MHVRMFVWMYVHILRHTQTHTHTHTHVYIFFANASIRSCPAFFNAVNINTCTLPAARCFRSTDYCAPYGNQFGLYFVRPTGVTRRLIVSDENGVSMYDFNYALNNIDLHYVAIA